MKNLCSCKQFNHKHKGDDKTAIQDRIPISGVCLHLGGINKINISHIHQQLLKLLWPTPPFSAVTYGYPFLRP